MSTAETVVTVIASLATVLSLAWVVLFGNRSAGDLRAEKAHGQAQAPATPSAPVLSNLPILPRLVGRGHEVRAVTDLLLSGESPGVLIKGPAGIGKSALAYEIARGIQETCERLASTRPFDGVFQISAKASPITTGALADAIGRFVGFPAVSAEPTDERKLEQLYRALVRLRLLVVVDNVETVTDPTVLGAVFRLPPTCRVLLTSRMGVADQPVQVVDLRPLSGDSSAELLQRELDRLGLGGLLGHDHDRIDDLLELTAGSPLGIKWAAGRLSQGIALKSVVDRLRTADADLFEATFADTWAGLSELARRALMCLSTTGASIDASVLAAALGETGSTAAENAIGDLVVVSLLEPQRLDHPIPAMRYGLHPLARAFAGRKLAEYPRTDAVIRFPMARALLRFFDDRRLIQLGPAEYDRLELELPNLLQCFHWLTSRSPRRTDGERLDLVVDMADAVAVLLWSRGYWGERIYVCRTTAELSAANGRELDAGRHAAFVGQVLLWQGNLEGAAEWTEKARPWLAAGEELDRALARRVEALIRHRNGHTEDAIAEMAAVLSVVRRTDDSGDTAREKIRAFADWVCPGPLGYLSGEVALAQEIGIMYADRGERSEAVYWLDESRRLSDRIGDIEGAAVSISHRGRALAADLPNAARASFAEALTLARSVGRRSTEGRCLLGLAQLAVRERDWRTAVSHGQAAYEIFRRLGMEDEALATEAVLESANRLPRPRWIRMPAVIPRARS